MAPQKLHPSLVPALENIYISPLETCNLDCHFCYTKKTRQVLSNLQITSFITRYSKHLNQKLSLKLKSITFCGGEVFLLPKFTSLINSLHRRSIFTSIITNGTIDRLTEITNPNLCQLLVSLDGPENIHDQNRGSGNYQKSLKFITHALHLGFHLEIIFVVTPSSYPFIKSFPSILAKDLSLGIPPAINYVTVKTAPFTTRHPLSQKNHQNSLTNIQIINLKRHFRSLPPKNFGCFQLSLQSNGQIYGCCESPRAIANITQTIPAIISSFQASLGPCHHCSLYSSACFGCCTPDFLCGYKKELRLESCQKVVSRFI